MIDRAAPSIPLANTLNAPNSSTSKPLSPERQELREAAQAFEAIFVRQMLASARATDFGGEGIFSSQGLEQFETMCDEHVADLASKGHGFGASGLGLARSIEEQLSAHLPQSPVEETGSGKRG